MLKLALAGALALALSVPAVAQECPVTTLDAATALMSEQGTTFMLLAPDAIPTFVDEIAEPVLGGAEIEGVTNVIVASLNGLAVFGLEIDGCLSAPVPMPGQIPARASGRMPDGSTGA
jgi:hypothetical protein